MAPHSEWVLLPVLLAAMIPAAQILAAAVRRNPCSPALCTVGVLGTFLNWMFLYALKGICAVGGLWVQTVAGVLFAAGMCALFEGLRRQERRNCETLLARQREQLEEMTRNQEKWEQEIQVRLDELRLLRHDLRHYLVAVDSLRPGGDAQPDGTEKLRVQLARPIPAASVLDAVVRHYVEEAETAGIAVDIRLDLGETGGITTPDLCLVLGNLLENAVEAVGREPAGGCIRMRCASGPGWLCIVVGNTFSGKLHTEKGRILSSKAENRLGKGLERVRRVAGKYGGKAQFTTEGDMFKASVFLEKPEPDKAPLEPDRESEETPGVV